MAWIDWLLLSRGTLQGAVVTLVLVPTGFCLGVWAGVAYLRREFAAQREYFLEKRKVRGGGW